MADYEDVKNFLGLKGIKVKTCYIAHVKEMCGLTHREAWCRGHPRANPCPLNKIEPIKQAFRHFGMID